MHFSKDQDYLWQNLQWIDCLVSDHAPHTLVEKKSAEPAYGFPGLETMLPLMLNTVSDGRISIKEITRLLHEGPVKIFNLKIDASTFTEVDLEEEYLIENDKLLTKCRWSPFNGWPVKGKVKKVYLRGKLVFDNGKILVRQGFGNCLY